MELQELEDIDLNEFNDEPLPVEFQPSSARRPRRGRVREYVPPPLDEQDEAFITELRAKQARPIATETTVPIEPARDEDLFATLNPGREQSLIRGDRGRINRARTIAATLDIPFSQAYDGEASYTKKLEAGAPDLFKEAGTSFMRGIGSAYVNLGRALDYLGASKDYAHDYIGFGQQIQQAYMPKLKAPEVSWKNFSNPEWYATTVAENLPTTLALIPAGVLGAYGAVAAGAAGAGVTIGAFGKTVLGVLLAGTGATVVTRPMEAAIEAAGAKQDAIQRGMTEAEADRAADKVFYNNLALGGIDVLQVAAAFTPLRVLGANAPKSLTARVLATSARVAGGAALEGGEETIQTAFAQSAVENIGIWDSLKRFNPDMKESTMVGALFGVGLPIAGSVFNALTERVQATMPDKVAEAYQTAEQAATARGLDPVAAQIEALDTVAATPEGQAHIEKVIGELKDIAEGKEIEPLTVEEMDTAIEKAGGEKEFVFGEQVEPEPEIIGDELIDSIVKEETSVQQVFGLEPGEADVETGQEFFVSEESYQAAQASLKKKISGLHAGIDPTVLKDFVVIGAYHIERGVRTFAEWSKTMLAQFGDAIKPHLQDIWKQARAKLKEPIYYRSSSPGGDNDKTGLRYFTEDRAVADKFAEGGEFGRKGAVSREYRGKLNTFDVAQVSKEEAEKIIGKAAMQYIEPDGALSFEAFEAEPGIQQRLADAGYDSIRISEGRAGVSIAVLPQGVANLVDTSVASRKQDVESVEDAEMPARDVKHQIRLTAGQERVAKMIREDVALSAGMKKAEQAARIAYREGKKDALEAAKADMRDIIIKAKVKAEQFGFREGFKVSEKLTRKELTQVFKDEQVIVDQTRKALVDIIQENLPPEMRGKFLDAIIAKLTEKKQGELLDRITAMKDKLTKKELIAELEYLQEMRGSINVEYQKKIGELIGDINTKNISAKTRENVEGLLEFAEREGMPSGVSRKTLNLIQRMEGRQAADMMIDELKELNALATHLTELGKLKQKLKYKYNEREKQKALKKLLATTHNGDIETSGRDTMLDVTKKGSWFVYTEGLNAVRMAEIMDGYKDGENGQLVRDLFHADLAAQWEIRTTIESAVKEAVEAGMTEAPTDEQVARIMVNIRNREGAESATLMLMEKFGYQEIPALTEAEEKFILILKKYSTDMFGDRIAAAFEEKTNIPFPRMEWRALPLKYEGDFNRPPEEVLMHTPHRVTETERGFTIERVEGVEKMPRVDIWAVFEEGINEQIWFLEMQPVLDNVKQLVKSKQYIEKAGETASNWWRDHLDIIGRRGWSAGARHNAFTSLLRTTRGNITNAILGYRVSSILIQPFAAFEAMAHAQGKWGTTAAAEVFTEVAKSWIVPGYAKAEIEGDPTHALALRKGGEVAIQEILQGKKSAFIRNGLKYLLKADVRTAAGVQQAVEKILTKHGIENAQREAAILMDMSQSSSDVSLRPHVLAWGEGARTWLTFGTFMLNQWGIIAHDLATKGLAKGEGAGRISALVGLGIIVAGTLAANESREYVWETIRRRKLPDRSMLQDALYSLASSIPVFGNIFSMASARHGGDIPVVKIVNDLLRVAFIPTMKTGEQQARAALRAAEAGLILTTGVPGTSQAFDVIEGVLFPEREKSQRIKPQAIKQRANQ